RTELVERVADTAPALPPQANLEAGAHRSPADRGRVARQTTRSESAAQPGRHGRDAQRDLPDVPVQQARPGETFQTGGVGKIEPEDLRVDRPACLGVVQPVAARAETVGRRDLDGVPARHPDGDAPGQATGELACLVSESRRPEPPHPTTSRLTLRALAPSSPVTSLSRDAGPWPRRLDGRTILTRVRRV